MKAIEEAGGHAFGIAADVGNAFDIARAADAAEAQFGPVNVLVNNAATNRHFGPIEEISEANWDHTLGVNLKAPFLMSQRIGKSMIAGGGGSWPPRCSSRRRHSAGGLSSRKRTKTGSRSKRPGRHSL